MSRITNIWRPEVYHGKRHPRKYFEGWYFKLVNKKEDSIFAIIPGVSYGIDGSKPHAFIQLIDGVKCSSFYQPYDIKDFHSSRNDFGIWIGPNYFSGKELHMDLEADGLSMKGRLNFRNCVPWPVSALSPGIMGWYSFVPFMECYHGVISLNHDISGSLQVGGRNLDYSGGRGYTEKDWGRSFPSSWIWMQSNCFDSPDVFFTASVARIPWFGKYFTGVIAGFWVKGRLYRFATYTSAHMEVLSHQSGRVSLRIRDKQLYLDIMALESGSGKLYSPRNGSMEGIIDESMTAVIKVTLGKIGHGAGGVIFEGTGRNGGLEVSGDISELQPD